MTLPPEQLRRLVRRDVMVAGGGAVIAISSLAIIALARFGVLSEINAGRAVVAVAAIVGAGCIWWWAVGPREYLRDRLIVLTPVFLIAGPGLVGVHYLGGGVAVGILSGAVGFSAAAMLGLAWGSRHPR
jgi:hypothetical protein